MPVSGVSGSNTNNIEVVDSDKVGFSGLTADDFLELLITQLQNQDPADPLDNQALLEQVTSLRNLQSDLELSTALEGVVSGQQLASASSFIGKEVTVTNDDEQLVTGLVERVIIENSKSYVEIDNQKYDVEKVTSISSAA